MRKPQPLLKKNNKSIKNVMKTENIVKKNL